MGRLVMGYWDCPYCEKTKIQGTLRDCPSCGHTRDKNTKFYMQKNNKQYLTQEEAKNKGKGADWICNYCEALNSTLDKQCKSCGAERTSKNHNYFSRNTQKPTTKHVEDTNNNESKKPNLYYLSIIPIIITIGIIIALLHNIFTPTIENLHIDSIYWKTTQEVETLKTYHKSGWTIPDGGRQTDKKYVIKTYEKVFDHYEDVQKTRTKQVIDHYEDVQKTRTKQVIDHYETKYSYSNNGDGTFTEKSYQEPVYRTETEYYTEKEPVYRTETEYYTEKEPVYRDEPIYAWKYWYDIDEWTVSDRLTEQGEKDVTTITYVTITTNEKTRKGNKYIQYFCDVTLLDDEQKHKTYELSEELYNKLKKNTDMKCKIQQNEIIELIE